MLKGTGLESQDGSQVRFVRVVIITIVFVIGCGGDRILWARERWRRAIRDSIDYRVLTSASGAVAVGVSAFGLAASGIFSSFGGGDAQTGKVSEFGNMVRESKVGNSKSVMRNVKGEVILRQPLDRQTEKETRQPWFLRYGN